MKVFSAHHLDNSQSGCKARFRFLVGDIPTVGGGVKIVGGMMGGLGVEVAIVDNACKAVSLTAGSTFDA